MASTTERAAVTDPVPAQPYYEPATGSDGRVFELTVRGDALNPFIDECPSWCEAQSKHRVARFDTDRSHCGRQIVVPLGSVADGDQRG
jgi:hypothetical protein